MVDGYRGLDCKMEIEVKAEKFDTRPVEEVVEDPDMKEPTLMEQMADACKYESVSDEEVEEDDKDKKNVKNEKDIKDVKEVSAEGFSSNHRA